MTKTHDFERAQLEIDGQVAVLKMNHTEVMNAVSIEMLNGMRAALNFAERPENNIRAIVWTGVGRGFCTGANLSSGGGSSSETPVDERDAGLGLETSYHPF